MDQSHHINLIRRKNQRVDYTMIYLGYLMTQILREMTKVAYRIFLLLTIRIKEIMIFYQNKIIYMNLSQMNQITEHYIMIIIEEEILI